jgi:hypothetical protein
MWKYEETEEREMWDQDTDRMFLELRDDAVLIFGQQSLRLLYRNCA